MTDIAQGDICRYYGETKPFNGLGGGEARRLARGVRGHWKDGRYIPEPAVAKFEQQLGAIIAARPCAGCGLPRGPGPLIASRRRFYHPACAPARAGCSL